MFCGLDSVTDRTIFQTHAKPVLPQKVWVKEKASKLRNANPAPGHEFGSVNWEEFK